MVTTNETRLKRFRTTKQSVLSAAVPSNYSIRRGKPTDSDCSRIALADAYDSLSAALRRHPKPSRRGLAAIRTHCPSPSAVGARAPTDDPVPADPHRPVLLGLALSFVAGLPGRRRHGKAGHRHPCLGLPKHPAHRPASFWASPFGCPSRHRLIGPPRPFTLGSERKLKPEYEMVGIAPGI